MALSGDEFDVNNVDRLLDTLGRGQHPADGNSTVDADDPLVDLLHQWRAEVSAEPLPEGPTSAQIDEVYAASKVTSLDTARRRRDDRRRSGRAHGRNAVAVAAAAVLAVAFGSLSVLAYNAGPGDPLWQINKNLFNHNAEDIELVAALERDLQMAHEALVAGDTARATQILDSVSDRIDGVQSAADRVNLIRLRDQIERDINREQSGNSGPVEAPAPPEPVEPPAAQPVEPQPEISTAPVPTQVPEGVPPPRATGVPLPTLPLPTIELTLPSVSLPPVPPRTSEPPVDPIDPKELDLLRDIPGGTIMTTSKSPATTYNTKPDTSAQDSNGN